MRIPRLSLPRLCEFAALLCLLNVPIFGMGVGTNFWFLAPSWSGETPFKENVDWANAYVNGDDIWDEQFISELAPYGLLRFMDWGGTNHSKITSWSERRLPDDAGNAHIGVISSSSAPKPGLSYEWMVDLCNRTNKDIWVCVPHMADANYWTQLAILLRDNVDPSLKIYVEYSNETWNGIFTQFQYTLDEGTAQGLPGFNIWYQGGAFHVYRSLQIFEAFDTVFASDPDRIVKVCAAGGNLDIALKGLRNVYNSPTWNPNGVEIDAFALAPYVGGADGADPDRAALFHAKIDSVEAGRVIPGKAIADEFGFDYITYECGQHLTNNAHVWSADPDIYDEYLYMMDRWSLYYDQFVHYTHAGNWASGGAWGAKQYTGQPINEAPKYAAIVDWVAANGGGSGGTGTPIVIDNSDAGFTGNFWGNQTWGSGFEGVDWAYRDATASGTATAQWTLGEAGVFEVFVRACGGLQTTNQPFRVVHANGTSAWIPVDMDSNPGTWVSIGTYTLDTNSFVETKNGYAPENGSRAVADAIQFVPTQSTETTVTLSPIADRDTQSSNSGTNSYFYISRWNYGLLNFDLSGVSGTVTEATLRIYKNATTESNTLSTYATSSDTWTETGTAGTATGSVLTTASLSDGAGWVEIPVTAQVDAEANGDGVVSIALRMVENTTWKSFASRESANPPELVITFE